MCGVAGLIRLDGNSIELASVKRMTDAIEHRGPDGEGQWVEGNIGIGHRRLSIIDLSATGHQPMFDVGNRFVLSYNGEVYNYIELRRELEKLGHRFRGKSDSEVVLNSFAQWGTASFLKFNGMFAIAVWDRQEKTLTLARDRYGIKPLYYASQSGFFLFGSEQKAILVNPAFSRNLNKAALLEYFTFQNIFTDQTLLSDVHLLKAGHFLELKLARDGSAHQSETMYWDYRFREPGGRPDRREYVEELERLFSQAIERQLVSDVEVGAYLSGGIDSGSIVAFASRKAPDLKTFTVGFDLSSAAGLELHFDERTKAEAISAAFGTEHYEMVLKSGDMEKCLPTLALHLEEPRVGQSYPNFYAAKLAGKFVKVVLAGTGGDELFGGYPWRYYRVAKARDFETYVDEYYLYWQRLVDNSEIQRLFEPIWDDVKHVQTRDIFRDVFKNHANELKSKADYVNHSLYFEAKTFLHGLFLVEDKLSMAHGLETRLPFMDNDLVDFAMSCPVDLKLNSLSAETCVDENQEASKKDLYASVARDGKTVFREMMTRNLPKKVSERKKQGFSSPDASWFRGESSKFIEVSLFSNNEALFGLLNKDFARQLVAQHHSGEKNRRLLVWSLLNIAEVMRWLLPDRQVA